MRIAAGLTLIAGMIASSAYAVDGVLEINQACAAGPGCFAGDAAAFPVEITTRGSYRLTSNLTPPDQNTDVISIAAAGVSVDLNGFAIEGTNTFSGPGGSCSASGSGRGVAVVALVDAVAISNGHVRGMGSTGIDLLRTSRIERVVAEQNCFAGIDAGEMALVIDSVARRNGGDGITGSTIVLIQNSVSDSNATSGIFGSTGRFIVRGSAANANGSVGIDLPSGNGNLVLDSMASTNSVDGMRPFTDTLVLRSSVNGNTLRGINGISAAVGFLTANGNPTNVSGATLVACSVIGGAQSCP